MGYDPGGPNNIQPKYFVVKIRKKCIFLQRLWGQEDMCLGLQAATLPPLEGHLSDSEPKKENSLTETVQSQTPGHTL